ncbi:hypothetical protein [Streptomyces collinus]|uniref:hypothetical protein n=1 Tax=Streptomyces collinus TaxID=42684 RepID=UPI0036995D92
MDTRSECENCNNVIHFRRSRRAQVADQVDRELPGLSPRQRRLTIESQLRVQITKDAEAQARRHKQALTAEQTRSQRAHSSADAIKVSRQAASREGCKHHRSDGTCEPCDFQHRTEALIHEAGLITAAWTADLTDASKIAAVTTHVRASLQAEIASAREAFLSLIGPEELESDPTAAESALAFNALQAVQMALPKYRVRALTQLRNTEAAESEAQQVYLTEHRRQQDLSRSKLVDAAKAADLARTRTAQHVLAARLERLQAQTQPAPDVTTEDHGQT